MKKTIGIIIVFLLLLVTTTNCYSDNRDRVIKGFAGYTDNLRNGHSLFDTESFHVYSSYGYLDGVYHTLIAMGKLKYDASVSLELYDKVKDYYAGHSEELRNPIVDTIIRLYGKQ